MRKQQVSFFFFIYNILIAFLKRRPFLLEQFEIALNDATDNEVFFIIKINKPFMKYIFTISKQKRLPKHFDS